MQTDFNRLAQGVNALLLQSSNFHSYSGLLSQWKYECFSLRQSENWLLYSGPLSEADDFYYMITCLLNVAVHVVQLNCCKKYSVV
jgi:hypothetical protein